MHGHTLGAAGAIEAVTTLLSLAATESFRPPSISQAPDPACHLNIVANQAREPRTLEYRGFQYLCFRRLERVAASSSACN